VLVQSLWTDDPSTPQALLGVYSSPLPKSLLFLLHHPSPSVQTLPPSSNSPHVSLDVLPSSPELPYLHVQILTLLLQQPNSPFALPRFPSRCFVGSCQLFWNTCCSCGHFMVDIQFCMDSGFTLRRCLACLPTISDPALLAFTSELFFTGALGGSVISFYGSGIIHIDDKLLY